MKKTFAFVLAVLGVTMAHALTWSTLDGNATVYDGKYATETVSFTLSQTAGCVTSDIGSETSVLLQSIVFAGRSAGQESYASVDYAVLRGADIEDVRVEYTTDGTIDVKYGSSTQTGLSAQKFTFNNVLLNTNTTYTLSFYDASDAAAKLGYSVVKNSPTNANAWTPAMKITATTNVPEPTVLALLALGVAGIALKRKVA